jgi:cytochrome c peroxidase
VSCASCHRPENAFSEPTPVSTGIKGQKGGRKAPTFLNMAQTLYPHFFWDGRAGSLEEQALGPVQNPIEMGNTIEGMIATLEASKGYAKYFEAAFGSAGITPDRVAQAIAAYERTRMSGNSPYDKWRQNEDEGAVSDQAKQGWKLFFGKAECNQCHLGDNFTDSGFHNLGIGWDADKKAFADDGRSAISNKDEDRGAFKTPGLRDISKHAPYMHDGSLATLEEVVEHYNKGGHANPTLSPKVRKLGLTKDEVAAVVAFMKALDGEGYQDPGPKLFP